jgi:hypothetical protein
LRLIAARRHDRIRRKRRRRGAPSGVEVEQLLLVGMRQPRFAQRDARSGIRRCGVQIPGIQHVVVLRHLVSGERHRFCARHLADHIGAEARALALADHRAAAKVGQPEGHVAVATESGSDQRIERVVLIDRQKLPGAERPAARSKVPGKDPDFT